FQAEDGIRDFHVTGVQTCALPISRMRGAGATLDDIMPALETIRDTNFVVFTVGTLEFLQKNGRIGRASALLGGLLNVKPLLTLRSEERRVGKESRSGWAPHGDDER